MYETLIMLKAGTRFTIDDLHEVVDDVMRSGSGTVLRDASHIRVVTGSGSLDIAWHDAAHVVEESNEIAEQFGVPCHGCGTRFEVTGDDPEMELFNDYLLINERLQATGNFVIFDSQECKLMFDESA